MPPKKKKKKKKRRRGDRKWKYENCNIEFNNAMGKSSMEIAMQKYAPEKHNRETNTLNGTRARFNVGGNEREYDVCK